MGPRLLVLIGTLLLALGAFAATSETQHNNTEKAHPDTIDRSIHDSYKPPAFQGFWKKKFVWRPRWVKTWQGKKIYVAVWKRMWSPAEVKEWLPVPKPPPGWVRHTGVPFIKVGSIH